MERLSYWQKWEGSSRFRRDNFQPGWSGHTLKDMKNVCKGADFIYEMEIQFDSTGGAELVTDNAKIEAWLNKIISMEV